jgi:hypothetical protein
MWSVGSVVPNLQVWTVGCHWWLEIKKSKNGAISSIKISVPNVMKIHKLVQLLGAHLYRFTVTAIHAPTPG